MRHTRLKYARGLCTVYVLIWMYFFHSPQRCRAHTNTDFHNCLLPNDFQSVSVVWIFQRMISTFAFHVLIVQTDFARYKCSTAALALLLNRMAWEKLWASTVYTVCVK